ncbi:hypothetical protein AAHE18_20G105900 [Arachis hypogaea]
MHSNNSSSAEKSFRIKHDERFFSKLMAKEEGSSSRIFYYGEKSVASVPFTWEAQPGTPKHPLSDSSLLPPLTPPPSFYSNNTPTSGKKKRRSYYSSKRVNDVISTIWLRLSSSKKAHHVSPSSSWSPSSSSSLSSSSWSFAYNNYNSSSSPSFSMRENHNNHGNNEGISSVSFSHSSSSSRSIPTATIKSSSTLKHNKCACGGFLIRGCYAFWNMKNATTVYFLDEIEGPEQKSDSEAEEGLQMLLDSDLPAFEVDFLELQNSKWRALNCVGN